MIYKLIAHLRPSGGLGNSAIYFMVDQPVLTAEALDPLVQTSKSQIIVHPSLDTP